MRLANGAADAAGRAAARAQRAAPALRRVDLIGHQLLAVAGRAALLIDVRFVFVAEILEGGKHRVRRGLSQTAQRRRLDGLGQLFQLLNVAVLAAAINDAFEDFQQMCIRDRNEEARFVSK